MECTPTLTFCARRPEILRVATPLHSLPKKYQDQVAPQIYPAMAAQRAGMSERPLTDLMRHTQQTFIVMIEPMGKPRMTQRDKWRKRDVVVRYREFADRLRAACFGVMSNPSRVSWKAFLPMSESWSKKKKALLQGRPHRLKPDRDNIDKAILDALWENDAGVASGEIAKFWDDGRGARIELTVEI